MPDLVHKVTGVRVSVSDETATRMGSEWGPASQPEPEQEPKRRGRARKTED